jgi:hypothetical protein
LQINKIRTLEKALNTHYGRTKKRERHNGPPKRQVGQVPVIHSQRNAQDLEKEVQLKGNRKKLNWNATDFQEKERTKKYVNSSMGQLKNKNDCSVKFE